jgi:hypothetical protein
VDVIFAVDANATRAAIPPAERRRAIRSHPKGTIRLIGRCPFRLIDRAVRMTGCVRSSSALSLWLRRTPGGDQRVPWGVQTQGGGRPRRSALTG